MKILIADNSKSIRVRIGFLLSDIEDVEIIESESGIEALNLMTSEDPPQIVLLAWMIEDLNGIEVCERFRRASFGRDQGPVSPYVILMTSKSSGEDIAKALDAGADDYIQKPWNDAEFRARIRVAKRSVHLQYELQRRYMEMESLLKRYEVAHQVIARGQRRTSRISYTDMNGRPSEAGSLVSSEDGVLSVGKSLLSAFQKIGCGEVISTPWDGIHPSLHSHVVWSASLIDDVGVWLDFLVQIDGASLEYLHEAISGAPATTPMHLSETLKGLIEIAQNEVRYALSKQNLQAWPLGTPTILTSHSNKLPILNPSESEFIRLKIGKAEVFISVSDEHSPIIDAEIRELERFQIVVEDFFAPWRTDTPILKKGTCLSPSHLTRLLDMQQEGEAELHLRVMRPSGLGLVAAKISALSQLTF